MQVHNKKRIAAAPLSAAMLATTVSGCALVQVDPAKDSAKTIASFDHQTVKKEDYNNMMAQVAIQYAASNQSMPTGTDAKELEKSVKEAVIDNAVVTQKAKDDKIKIDTKKAKKTGESSYKSIKKQAGKKYQTTLKAQNTNDKSFHQYMINSSIDNAYAEKISSNFKKTFKKNPDKYYKASAGKANGKTVTTGEYYYYAFLQELTNELSGSNVNNDQNTAKKQVFQTIATDRSWIQYCDKHGIEISNATISKQEKKLKKQQSQVISDKIKNQVYESYYLTDELVNKYNHQHAKALACKSTLKAYKIKQAKDDITNAERSKYFNKHKDEFVTVSAEHILATNKKTANKIYKEAKGITKKSAFDALIKKYHGKSGIREASDLGAFKKADMVKSFANAAFKAEVNTVTKPVKSVYGYHVIYVYSKDNGTSWKKYKTDIDNAIAKIQSKESYSKAKTKIKENVRYKVNDEIKSPQAQYIDSLEKTYHVKEK